MFFKNFAVSGFKGHNRQHSGKMSHNIQYWKKKLEKHNQLGQLRYVVKYKVRTMAKSFLKHHRYCPMLLLPTTKTAVCLQRPCFITFMGLNWCSIAS